MKKKYVLIIVLCLIVIIQFIYILCIPKCNENNEIKPVSFALLDKLIVDKYQRIYNYNEFTSNYTDFELAKEIDTLTSFIIFNKNVISNDKLERYKKLITKYLAITNKECNKIISDINSKNSTDRKYFFRLLEYAMISKIAEDLRKGDYKLDAIGITCIPDICPNNLKVGEDFIGHLYFLTHPINDTIKVSIEGMKDTIITNLHRFEIRVPSTTTGKKEIKGKATFVLSEEDREATLPFSVKYEVE